MPVKVQCPNPACGKSGSLADVYIGKAVRCAHCGTELNVPGATTVVSKPPAHPVTVRVSASAGGPIPLMLPRVPEQLPETPKEIGRFQIRARLGAGAFGTVYRAYDPQLEREVALKVPQEGTINSPSRIHRFLREAKVAARLRHAHIVPVYDAGIEGKHYYIASAFIEGRTLAELLDDGPPDCRRAAEIVRDLAEALAYAHDQGIVHRDVKPANIMVDAPGNVHLMDFGLARRQDGVTKLTRIGALVGTPAYMAPEYAQGQTGDVKPASDQYSLGVILYELLCGQQPFQGPPKVVLFNAMHKSPPPPRAVNPQVPAELEAICQKALAKRPQDRYPDCKELARGLERWLQTARSSPETPAALFAPVSARPAAGAWMAVLAGAAVLILGTVLTVWIMVNSSEPAGRDKEHSQEPEPPDPHKDKTGGGFKPPKPPEPVGPQVRLSTVAHVTLSPGDRTTLPVHIDRAGYQGLIQFKLEGLPHGVLVPKKLFIGARETEMTFDLAARDDARAVERREVHVLALGERPLGKCSFQITIEKPASAQRHNPPVLGLDLDNVHICIVQAPVSAIDYVKQKGVYVLVPQEGEKIHAESLHFAETIRPTRMVVVTSTFPYREQAEAFRKALRLPRLGESQAIPQFLGFDVERRVTWPPPKTRSGQPIGDTGEWRRILLAPRPKTINSPVPHGNAGEWQNQGSPFRELLAGAPAVERLPQNQKPLALPGLVMPLPRLAGGLTYPALQLKGIPNPEPVDPKWEPRPLLGKNKPQVAAVSVKTVFPWDQLLDATRDKLSGKSVQLFHPDGGNVQTGPPEKSKAVKPRGIPEKCLFRFVDVEVQPGHAYEYRIVLCLANPNFGKTKEVADARDARVQVLRSQPHPLPKVMVPYDVSYYAVDEKELQAAYGNRANPAMVGAENPRTLLVPYQFERPLASQEVAVQIHRWVERVPDQNIHVGSWLIAERLLFHRGEYIQRQLPLQVPMWIQVEEQFKIFGQPVHKRQKAFYPTVEFTTRTDGGSKATLLLDIYGGRQIVKVGGKPPVTESSAEELLVLTPDGNLIVRDGREDSDPNQEAGRERLERYQAWKRWIKSLAERGENPKKKDPFGRD